ncbi:ferredoxin-type protein NapF [Arcobacter sp. 15-2]|uniref:ferredoxin-type protein NapF n=1 Tax=Arcobacter sp. 15-2 TaxID=3374109 RepID=UPI00399CFFC9
MDRRELFGSLFSSKEKEKKQSVVRPPYFVDEDSFLKECIECDGICSTFCEENIIVIQENKTPKLEFSKSGCTYCDECAKACPSDVLKVEYKKNIPQKIEIDILKCMSWHDTMCFSCKDPCLEDAIEFLGMFRPSIVDDKCTSCGFCISRCPTQAIIIKD